MMYWEAQIILEDFLKKGLISLDRGRVISSIDLNKTPGNYPVYSSSAQKNGYFGEFGEYDFDEELITWSVDGGGYFFYRPKHKFSVTNVSGILKINNAKELDYKFLYYALAYQHSNQVYDYVDKAHPSVIKKRYYIPKIDLTEQQKIAQILTKVDEAIAQTEKLIAKYQRIKTGLMQDLLTKGIDKDGNIRNEVTHQFKDSPLGRIPVEWESIPFSKYGQFKNGLNYSKSNIGSGLKIIGVSDFKDNFSINYENLEELNLKQVHESYLLKNRDLLFVRSNGNKELVGRVLYINNIKENVSFSGFTIKANISEEVSSKYIAILFTSFLVRNQLIKGGGGTNINNLSQDILGEIILNIPETKEEQYRIINSIDSISNFIANQVIELEKLKKVKRAMEQDLLSGKKRVTHLLKQTV